MHSDHLRLSHQTLYSFPKCHSSANSRSYASITLIIQHQYSDINKEFSDTCLNFYQQFVICMVVCFFGMQLLFSPFFFLSFNTFWRSSSSFLSAPAINTVSSECLLLLKLWEPSMYPGRGSDSLRIASFFLFQISWSLKRDNQVRLRN